MCAREGDLRQRVLYPGGAAGARAAKARPGRFSGMVLAQTFSDELDLSWTYSISIKSKESALRLRDPAPSLGQCRRVSRVSHRRK